MGRTGRGSSAGMGPQWGGTGWTVLGVTCAVVPLEPGSWLPPLLPQTLSLYPTNLPPSALQEKCMEEVGSGAASKWPGAVLDLRTKDHRFHCQERCTGDQAKPAGAQPCGLNACNLTAISVLRAPSWVKGGHSDTLLLCPFLRIHLFI